MCAGLATADNDLDLSTDDQTEGLMTAYQQRMLQPLQTKVHHKLIKRMG